MDEEEGSQGNTGGAEDDKTPMIDIPVEAALKPGSHIDGFNVRAPTRAA